MTPIKLSVAIMSHPSRLEPLKRLRKQINAQIIMDPLPDGPRSPWRTARLAWAQTPPNCTHRLVLQDDVILCSGFQRAARLALAAKPDVPVSFFVNGIGGQLALAQRQACEDCLAWAELPLYGWYPTLALALPRAVARALSDYVGPERPIADDAVVARFLNEQHMRVWQTVPSLVQHDEAAPSTLTRDLRYGREASLYIGEHSPTLIDWSRG